MPNNTQPKRYEVHIDSLGLTEDYIPTLAKAKQVAKTMWKSIPDYKNMHESIFIDLNQNNDGNFELTHYWTVIKIDTFRLSGKTSMNVM